MDQFGRKVVDQLRPQVDSIFAQTVTPPRSTAPAHLETFGAERARCPRSQRAAALLLRLGPAVMRVDVRVVCSVLVVPLMRAKSQLSAKKGGAVALKSRTSVLV